MNGSRAVQIAALVGSAKHKLKNPILIKRRLQK
jgi:hypothetical protein